MNKTATTETHLVVDVREIYAIESWVLEVSQRALQGRGQHFVTADVHTVDGAEVVVQVTQVLWYRQ